MRFNLFEDLLIAEQTHTARSEDIDVGGSPQDPSLEFFLETAVEGQRNNECGHSGGHSDDRDHSNDRNDRLFPFRSEISKGYEKFKLHSSLTAGLKWGKRITSRIELELVRIMASRSIPIPSPAVGGIP